MITAHDHDYALQTYSCTLHIASGEVVDLTDDGPRLRVTTPSPDAGPPSVSFEVTPDNVVELATTFRAAADILKSELPELQDQLRIRNPWLGDPFSEEARGRFNDHLADGDNSFANEFLATYHQYDACADALEEIATAYGLMDERNAEKQPRIDGPR